VAPRRVVVFGPVAQVIALIALLAAAVALAFYGLRVECGMLVIAVVSRMLPVEKGRPGDVVRVVTRGTGQAPRRAPTPLPLPPPPDDD